MPKHTNTSMVLRDLLGITQQQLADLLNVSREMISKVENESRGMSSELLTKTNQWERIFFYDGQTTPREKTLNQDDLETLELIQYCNQALIKTRNAILKQRIQLEEMERRFEIECAIVHTIRSYFQVENPSLETSFCKQLLGFESAALERLHANGPLTQFKLKQQLALNIKMEETLSLTLKQYNTIKVKVPK